VVLGAKPIRRFTMTGRRFSRGLLVLDLEATLLLDPASVRVTLSAVLGTKPQLARSVREVAAQRVRMAARLRGVSWNALRDVIAAVPLVPHAAEAILLLQQHDIACAIVTDGWELAADWIAARLDITHVLGTGIEPSGKVVHVWPEDRLEFVQRTAFQLQVPLACTHLLSVRQSDLLETAGQFIAAAG
jgi:phosphoserine phosphatase